jgi:serine/threonine protein kinase
MNEEEIFNQALSLPPEARPVFLDHACAGDPAIRASVEELLRSYDDASGFLDAPAYGPVDVDAVSPTDARIGAFIGHYRLLEQIGEGGMGTVYLAEQTHPVRRQVALKVIKPGMDSRRVVARFEAERQALALMDHPNIARVLDAGATDLGRPYFVMEYVPGVPMTRFCDEARLTVEERLRLFIPVCDAIQHAHQKGIIHRDVKPTNVIVTLYDGKPVPKVIDFGVAKAVEQEISDPSLGTQFGQVVGTLEYMAPEQAESSAKGIDTRADVYSLGVVLYELLVGSTPLSRDRMEQRTYAELVRVITDLDPPTPSTRLGDSGERMASISAVRQTEPKKLAKLVRGELDWIVMRCLEKDRDRRYASANELAADLFRHLNDEPVQAGPPSTWYRVRKFARRNKGPVLAATLILLTLIGGVVGTTWGMLEAKQGRKEAEDERAKAIAARNEAKEDQAIALATVRFVEDRVFAAARPKGVDGGLGKDVSLKEAIVASLTALTTDFKSRPLVEARLRSTMGTTFDHLGDPNRALEQYQRAYEIYRKKFGPEHLSTLESVAELTSAYIHCGRQAEAIPLLEQSIGVFRRLHGSDRRELLFHLHNLANAYMLLDCAGDSLPLRLEVVAYCDRRMSPNDREALRFRIGLANTYYVLKRHADAAAVLEKVVATYDQSLPDHSDGASAKAMLANAYGGIGRKEDALRLNEQAVGVMRKAYPADSTDLLTAVHNLAGSYMEAGRFSEAVKLLQEAVAGRKKALSPDHFDTLASVEGLASALARSGRLVEAIELNKQVLAGRRRILPKDHPLVLYTMCGIAHLSFGANRGAEAIPLIDEVYAKTSTDPFQRGPVGEGLVAELLPMRFRHFVEASSAAGCRETAEMYERRINANDVRHYDVACMRAIASELFAKGKRPAESAADADKAVAALKTAVAAGFNDRARLEKDDDLIALRGRDDFKKLVASMKTINAKSADSPTPAAPKK